MNNNPLIWVFDVDGVITNPTKKRIAQQGLAEEVAGKINHGDIVTFNTGRSIDWVEERVLNVLLKNINDNSKLLDLFVVGEKGATWAFYKENKLITEVDKTCRLPDSLRAELKELINNEFSDCMFYDESKLTLISLEMLDGYNLDDYTTQQKLLISKLREILAKPEYSGLNARIDATIIAVDVQSSITGKHMGARRIEQWLKQKNINPSKIIMIGDSQFDTEMAEELQDEYLVEFVFVGEPTKLDTSKLKNEPIITDARYDKGTLEALKRLG